MNYTDTIYEAVCLLDEVIRSFNAPREFPPQFLSDRIGGAPTTIGKVQAQIVSALRCKGHNVRYVGRKFCFDAPLRLPGFSEDLAGGPRNSVPPHAAPSRESEREQAAASV